MKRSMYRKVREAADQGFKVTMITTVKGMSGRQENDMRKTLMIRSEKYLYDILNIVQDGENTVIYEPVKGMEKENGLLHFNEQVKTDLDYEVIQALAEIREPAVTATILSTETAAEFGAGAKAVITRKGKIAGDIGSAAERAVMPQAIEMAGQGTYCICTAELEKEGGLTCILLEDL